MYRRIDRALVIVLVFALLSLSHKTAHAATITVTTTVDELNVDGDCSLREAVRAANLNQAVDLCPAGTSVDTIALAAATYTLQRVSEVPDDNAINGDLDLAGLVRITGVKGSTTIAAHNLYDGVVHVLPGATVQITGVVLTGGYVDISADHGGGGVFNEGTMGLTDSVVRDNNAAEQNGGGIFNASSGTLSLLRTDVAANDGSRSDGGGIYNWGHLTITASTIRDNSTDGGGGLVNSGTLTMTTTTVSNNSAASYNVNNTSGGGILNTGTATVRASTIHGNRTIGGGRGGGIYTTGSIWLSNTTIHGNVVGAGAEEGSVGGGIANNGGTVSGGNNTITGNTVAGTSAVPGRGAGIYTAPGSLTWQQNTILAGNTGIGTATSDCVGPLTSYGYNLIRNPSGCLISNDTSTNILGVDPLLGPLQNNGGLTATRMVPIGSPALDAGNPSSLYRGACASTDQRDVARPRDGNGDGVVRCDIGSVER